MGAKYFGASVLRREDPRLLRGAGRFVDDIKLPGLLHAAFVRSPHAHARVGAIRTGAAVALPGVLRIFTFDDLARWMKPLPLFGAVTPGLVARVDVHIRQAPQLALARDVVRYVGEIVAMVLADSRALGWTPGMTPALDPPDMAWRLVRGSDLVIQLHMTPSGKPETVRPSVGFYFSSQPPTRTRRR